MFVNFCGDACLDPAVLNLSDYLFREIFVNFYFRVVDDRIECVARRFFPSIKGDGPSVSLVSPVLASAPLDPFSGRNPAEDLLTTVSKIQFSVLGWSVCYAFKSAHNNCATFSLCLDTLQKSGV